MAAKAKRAKTRTNRLTGELLETARDMRASGLLTKAEHEKITMRHKADIPAAVKASLSERQVKALRKQPI
jgi:putative transcriptional regulator